jgi:Protein of unknown function (DUF3570)
VEVAVAATKSTKTPGGRLAAFTAAALSLPGIAKGIGVQDIKPESFGIDSSVSNYQESNGRMSVQAFQNDAGASWGDGINFKVLSTLDYIGGGNNPMNQNLVGGASPVFYWGKGNYYGKQEGAMELSQATKGIYKGKQGGIFDQRVAVSGQLSKQFDDVNLSLSGGNSTEWDYISNFFNLDGTWDLNQKNTTLAGGFGYASDTVWADGGNQGQIHETYSNGKAIGGNKYVYQGLLGLTQILDKDSLVQINMTLGNSSGFLSDPYKSVWVNNIPNSGGTYPQNNFCQQSSRFDWQANLCADNRPGSRTQEAVMARYIYNFEALNQAALHVDYRFYSDSWNVNSHTFDLSWYQPLPFEFMLAPHARYYTQRSSFFYQNVYNAPTTDGYYSSDYRLASFGAVSGGFSVNKILYKKINLGGGVDWYQRSQGMGFMGGTGSAVDNYSFTIYSFNVNIKL